MKSNATLRLFVLLLWSIPFICSTPCEAQRWRKVLDFPNRSGVKDVVILANGDIISLINTDSMIIVAMDQQGAVKWRKSVSEGTGLVIELIDDHLLVGGVSGSSFSAISVLFKLALDGSMIWQKTYEEGFISSIKENGSGYLLGGNLDRNGSSSNSVLYSVDSNGIAQWMQEYDIYSNSGVSAILDFGTDLYLVINASTVGVGFEGTVLIKARPSDGQMIWRRDKYLGYYENFPDDNDFLRPIDVSIDALNEIVIAAPQNASSGLVYSYSLDGELTSSVQVGQTLPHAIHILQNGDYLLAGILEETVDGTNAVVERRTPAGAVVWQRTIGQGSFFAIGMYGDTIIAAGTDQDFRSTNEYRPYVVKMTLDGRIYNSAIHFEVTEDLNENCTSDISDQPLSDIIIQIDDQFVHTGANGIVEVDVDTGWYDYKLDLPAYMHLCTPQQSIYVKTQDEVVPHYILVKREQCSDLSVGITYTEFIRGETSRFYVQYNNTGTLGIADVVLNIQLDDRIHLEAVSSSYVTMVDGIQISIPFLPPNFSDRISLDVRIDEDLVLFSTICIEASMTPHSSCDPDALIWDGPDLELNGVCENNMVVFRVKNNGSDMSDDVPYELFADGYRFEEGNIQLQANQERVFNIASGGSTISMRSRQVQGYPFNAAFGGSVEACGIDSEETSSLGMVRMFDSASPFPYVSRACIEVRDEYSADRVFEIARGLGRYHFIDSTQSQYEFSLMYQNHTEEPIDKLELFIKPAWQFDAVSFMELASSHPVEHELFGIGTIRLASENMNLLPGEQMQYRFSLDLRSGSEFVSVGASGVANDSIAMTLYDGFYNRNTSIEFPSVSPFVKIDNGKIIGRGHTWDFDQALLVLENGTVIYSGSTSEFGVDSRTFIQATAPDNSLIWQHTYSFKEGGALLRKILATGDGRMLCIGSIDDNQVPNNFINDAYAWMLMLDENGHELWRKVWKPGNGAYVGGSLNNGHYYHDDKILLLGFRYTPSGGRQFLMETDINGDIHWIRDFILGTNTWGDPVIVINSIPMKVTSTGNIIIVANESYETFIVKLDVGGNILDQSVYEDTSSMRGVNQKDFVILDNDELLLVGDGYSYDSEFNITPFGILIRLDTDFKFIEETIILDHFYNIELNAATLRDSVIFAAGAIQVDSSSGTDAVILRTDIAGANPQILRIVDFGARDYAYNVVLSGDGRVYAGVQTQTIDNFYNLQMGYFWTTDTITAIHNISGSPDHIQVFPNPAHDVVNIVSPKSIIKANAYAMNGTMMQLTEEGDHTYSVRGFPPGIYLLVVYTADDTRYIARFVKAE